MSQQKSHGVIELVKTVVYAVLIALVVRTFAYEPFSIPSGSMIPTLLVGDYLFVSKFSYGYSRYSLPLGLPLIQGRVMDTPPERGDVVVFKLPTDNSTDYIKRIVGLPGDKIQVSGGILHINGEAVGRRDDGDYTVQDTFGNVRRFRRYIEVLPGGREHLIIEESDNSPFDNTGVYTVPEGHFFAMGDNRDSSRDSRFLNEVGFVPYENLVGRAEFIFFSVQGEVWKIWNWYDNLRVDRIFDGIE
ncbi:MAG: signal peptidase I [Rhodospirillales bacterium]|nr:signal peptidase I [Rhodospirillales bacterium]